MDIDIRQVSADEAAAYLHPLSTYAFGRNHPTTSDDITIYERIYAARPDAVSFFAFLDDEPVASAIYSPMVQNVRGVLRGCSAVWGVTSHPRIRRQGVVRTLMQELYLHSREALPFSTLYPFRASFYGRLGYARFPAPLSAFIKTEELRPTLHMELPIQWEHTTLRSSYGRFLSFLEAHQRERHGLGIFAYGDVENLARQGKDRYTVYVSDEHGQTLGVMCYRIDDEQRMSVWPFFTRSALGRYGLLNWCARHIDQCPEVRFFYLPPDARPDLWLPDIVPTYHMEMTHPPMGRIVELSGLVKLPVGEGTVAFQLEDEHAPWNAEGIRLRAVEGELYLETSDTPTFTLTINALSALVYGTHDPAVFAPLGWGNPTPEQQQALRRLFPPMPPHLFEKF